MFSVFNTEKSIRENLGQQCLATFMILRPLPGGPKKSSGVCQSNCKFEYMYLCPFADMTG